MLIKTNSKIGSLFLADGDDKGFQVIEEGTYLAVIKVIL